MDRRSQQNHIRAARDWLGRAEDSLARDNDVQGDLKLMLAKAELAHVGQCPRSRRLALWGRRAGALLAAVGLAAVVLWDPAPGIPAAEGPGLEAIAVGSQPVAQVETPVIEKNPEQSPPPAATVTVESASPPAVEAEPAPRRENAASVPASSPPIKKDPLPDAAKQQLMQSAGKILRQ